MADRIDFPSPDERQKKRLGEEHRITLRTDCTKLLKAVHDLIAPFEAECEREENAQEELADLKKTYQSDLAKNSVYKMGASFALVFIVAACIFDFSIIRPAMVQLLTLGGVGSGWIAVVAHFAIPIAFAGGEIFIAFKLAYYADPGPHMVKSFRRYFIAMFCLGVFLATIPAGAAAYIYSAALDAMEDPDWTDKLAVLLFPAAAFIIHLIIVLGWRGQRDMIAQLRYNYRLKKSRSTLTEAREKQAVLVQRIIQAFQEYMNKWNDYDAEFGDLGFGPFDRRVSEILRQRLDNRSFRDLGFDEDEDEGLAGEVVLK